MKSHAELLSVIASRQSIELNKAIKKVAEIRNESERLGSAAYKVALEAIDKLNELNNALWKEYDELQEKAGDK